MSKRISGRPDVFVQPSELSEETAAWVEAQCGFAPDEWTELIAAATVDPHYFTDTANELQTLALVADALASRIAHLEASPEEET